MTPQEFRNEVLGKGFNIDGAYGNQCWDGYAYYMQRLTYGFANCTVTGYVRDIWEHRASNGMLDSCDEVAIMQQGDIAVFKVDATWTPYSHIAIFMRDLGNGFGLFLGQNQGGANGVFNEIKLPYSATYDTAFRPKCYRDLFSKPPVAPSQPAPQAPDQILNIGSIVEFAGFLQVQEFNPSNGMIRNDRIGGWINPSVCFEDSANDGSQDQYFATTNATFTIQGRFTVGQVKQIGGTWCAYLKELDLWVRCEPLIEVVNA